MDFRQPFVVWCELAPILEGHARVDKEVSLPLVTTSAESLPPKELVCQGKGDKVDKGDKGEA